MPFELDAEVNFDFMHAAGREWHGWKVERGEVEKGFFMVEDVLVGCYVTFLRG